MSLSTIQSTLVAAATVACLAPVSLAERVDLSASLELNRTASYVYEADLNEVAVLPMGERETAVNFMIEFDTTVVKADDQYTDVEVVFNRVSVVSSMGDFDSETNADPNDLLDATMRPVIGHSVTIRISDRHQVFDVTGVKWDHVNGLYQSLYSRMFSEGAMTKMLQPVFALKTEPPTAETGETWTDSLRKQKSVGIMRIDTIHTLKAVENGWAFIDITGTHEFEGVRDNAVSQKITEQSITGSALWNAEAQALNAYLVEREMVVTAGGDFAMEITIYEKERFERTDVSPKWTSVNPSDD